VSTPAPHRAIRCPLAPASLGILLCACSATATVDRIEPTSVQVAITGELGTQDAPLDFSGDPITRSITVQTLDRNGDPYAFNGDLTLRVRPGKLDQSQWIAVSDGHWEGDITFHSAFGPTRIWAGDEGDKDSESGRAASYGTGVSEPLQFAYPTLRQMNEIDDHETNQLAGEFAELRIADRQAVVTTIGAAGFWVTDVADKAGAWNSLYVYTFSKPDGIWEGARLTRLTGITQEYLATTQLSYPDYQAEPDVTLPVPDPILISGDLTCDNNLMEGLESSLVTVSGASIPSDFVEGSQDWADYLDYGQWPIDLADGGCRIYGDSSTSPDFHPTEQAGQQIGDLTGLLREIFGKWIITARGQDDIGAGGLKTYTTRPRQPARRIRQAIPRAR